MDTSRLNELREKHPQFVYEKFQVEKMGTDLELKFFYTLKPDLHFTTQLTFHDLANASYNHAVVSHWAFQIGLVEALSYWKATCSPEFIIRAGYLNHDQLQFWKNLIHKGMSEFFFINQIDGWKEGFVQFKVEAAEHKYKKDTQDHQEVFIVPLGGGKDSVVSLEVLKGFGQPLATLEINPTPQVHHLLKAAQVSENIRVTRQLDPQILQLNAQGYLNGHTPFSAMASFVTTLAAYLHDSQYVTVSNEFSANEGNTLFLGQPINHQYSKTLEYETAFRQYCQNYLSTTIEYFSFLRPLHELQIAGLFTRFPQYFPLFLSCNRGQKTGKWCGECPKCLFVYVMLSAFLKPEEVKNIFGQDLFMKPELLPILDELSGMVECKSLECVGTRHETSLALLLALQKYEGQELPPLLQYAQDKILPFQNLTVADAKAFLIAFQDQHFLPATLAEKLYQEVQKLGTI